jgi:hypothetical protein
MAAISGQVDEGLLDSELLRAIGVSGRQGVVSVRIWGLRVAMAPMELMKMKWLTPAAMLV